MYRYHKGQASQSPGFVERGLSCNFVITEQMKLAKTLGLESDSIEALRKLAKEKIKESGILARLEVQGLPNFLK
jgi:hypothetical protein